MFHFECTMLYCEIIYVIGQITTYTFVAGSNHNEQNKFHSLYFNTIDVVIETKKKLTDIFSNCFFLF